MLSTNMSTINARNSSCGGRHGPKGFKTLTIMFDHIDQFSTRLVARKFGFTYQNMNKKIA
jgi:hypothetical protein